MKYSLTKKTKTINGVKLYQIKAERSFGSVKKGDLGGYIEKESNLSHDGNAWVADNAKVHGNALVLGSIVLSAGEFIGGGYGYSNTIREIQKELNDRTGGVQYVLGDYKITKLNQI